MCVGWSEGRQGEQLGGGRGSPAMKEPSRRQRPRGFEEGAARGRLGGSVTRSCGLEGRVGRGGGELDLSLRLERVVLESALPGTEI